MKQIPMIFNSDMVKALIDGRKTVTRRPAKGVSYSERMGFIFNGFAHGIGADHRQTMNNIINRPVNAGCPANVGDLIYVRETFATLHCGSYEEISPNDRCCQEIRYKATENQALANEDDWEVRGYKWRPSIHMPKHCSRLTLKVTDVKIEPVTDISDEQAVLEGMPSAEEAQAMAIEAGLDWYQRPRKWFESLWGLIYGKESWTPSQYVWVIEFEVIKQNVTKVAE